VNFRTLVILSCFVLITACSSAPKEGNTTTGPGGHKPLDPDANSSQLGSKSKPKGQIYKVQKTKPLELPPDLLNSSNEVVQDNIESYTPDEERVLPDIDGARIVSDDTGSWLEVDSTAEKTWKAMTEFWSLSGITLVDYNPEAGIMETDWIEETEYREEGDSAVKNIFKDAFHAISSQKTARDKYYIRLERVGENKTEMHVTHRQIAKKESSRGLKYLSDFEWVELPDDPNKIDAFLQNIVLLFDQSGNS
jgi:uncharacterized lipoprotein